MTKTKTRRNGRTPTPASDNRLDLAQKLLAKAEESKSDKAPAAAPQPQTDIQLVEKALPEGSVRISLKRGQAEELAELEAAIAADIAHLQTLKQSLASLHRFAIAGEGHDAAAFVCVAVNTEKKDAPELMYVPVKKQDEFRQAIAKVARAQ